MPKVKANNYEMHYEVDDFTDPWKPAETLWIQHGFGRSSRFWYHWVPPLAAHYRVLRRDMRGQWPAGQLRMVGRRSAQRHEGFAEHI